MPKQLLTILLVTLVACLRLPVMAQTADPAPAPEYRDGVYQGEAAVERVEGSLPADEGLYSDGQPGEQRLTQRQKAEQLKENDASGGALTIISMVIVVMALAVLSALFLVFGRISSALQSRRKKQAHGPKAATADPETVAADSGDVIAAIAAALSEHFSGKHDMEDTILTIRRMKRAYSPWNSKIYNIRVAPEVHKN